MTMSKGWMKEEDQNRFLQRQRNIKKMGMSFEREIKKKKGG